MKVDKTWEGEGRIERMHFDSEMNMLQFRTIISMSGLPVLKYKKALMMKGSARLNVGNSRSLE